MDIIFSSKKLEKEFNSDTELGKVYGNQRAKAIMKKMTQLAAADSLEQLRNTPGRCHALKGDLAGVFSLDLDGPSLMTNTSTNQFRPNYSVVPGEILIDALEERSISQSDLALRMGRPIKTINEIVQGKTGITADTALQLERVLNIPAKFWLNLESNYQNFSAKERERARLMNFTGWLKQIPVSAMIKFGWISKRIDPVAQLQEVLSFYGIASPEVWNEQWLSPKVAFRNSETFEKEPGAASAWLRRGEILAQQINCKTFDAKGVREAIFEIRELTLKEHTDIKVEITKKCATYGIAVVFVPGLSKAHISGASKWLTPQKALIQINLRHGTDDHFWLTFFHEMAHILLHGKKEVFLDVNPTGEQSLKEHEANSFASDILMPPKNLEAFVSSRKFDKRSIVCFAQEIGIAPGVVVGKLQRRELIDSAQYNDLKRQVI